MARRRTQESPIKRFFGSRIFLIVAFLLVALVAFGYARAYYQDYRIRQEISALEDQVKRLETKKLESMELLKYVSSDAFVEEKARTELNLKKPGEHVVVIRHEENRPFKETTAEAQEEDLSNPIKWWYYFTHVTPPDEAANI